MITKKGYTKGMNPYIAYISFFMILLFTLYTILAPEHSSGTIDRTRTFITLYANVWYVVLGGLFFIFCLAIAISPYGKIKLGDDDETPEYSYFAWFAMLYAAGQGIGIIFWSIAEPMFHFASGTPFSEATAKTAEAANDAMTVTFFHWGLNAWGIYCIVALALAFFTYRMKKPFSIRYTLYPLLGKMVEGWLGTLIDIIAVFATIFGIATSLGLGVQQINAGLNAVWGVPQNVTTQLLLISVISACALLSVISGVGRGIKYMSIANMWLTIILLLFFIVLGPTLYIIKLFFTSSFSYLIEFIPMNLFVEGTEQSFSDPESSWKGLWQGWWTVFYWGWWMSWAPFVGVFVARVSRGRTIREFVIGVVGVSSILSFVWLAAYGGTALYSDLMNGTDIAGIVQNNVADALYATIDSMNLGSIGTVASAVGTLLVATYFITSSDSGTLVIATIMSEGEEHPLYRHRVFWGVMEGMLASVLLVVGGNAALSTLQTASIAAALPFSVIMLLMCVALIKGLHQEHRRMSAPV